MLHHLIAIGLLSSASLCMAQGNTGAKMSDYAAAYGGSAGNDLANEIVSRISAGNDASLKDLIATEELASELREKCKEAVQRLVGQEKARLLWQVTPSDDAERRKVLISDLQRDFKLDLGKGLKWDRKVNVSWALGALKEERSTPPVHSRIWLSFEVPTLPALGGPDMQIGGGSGVSTAVDP